MNWVREWIFGRRPRRRLLAAASTVAALLTYPGASAADTLRWEELRSALRDSVCVDVRDIAGTRAFSYVVGDPDRCPGEPADERPDAARPKFDAEGQPTGER